MPDEFKIETVKWEWAKEVQRKEVYRDDEFVRTKTKEEALKAIDFLMKKPQGSYTYTITVHKDDEYFTYYRHSMPCFGGLVKYKDSHGENYWMNPYLPRDIRVAFPEGNIIYIAIQKLPCVDLSVDHYKFLFSDESPWIAAFGTIDSIIFEPTYYIFTNMDTDPTVLYSLLRLGRLSYTWSKDSTYGKWNPKAELIAMTWRQADPRRLAGQKPIKTSAGTWAQGFGYTRPHNESIFKTEIKTPFENFKNFPIDLYAAQLDTAYFVKVMKEKFDIALKDDGSGTIPVNDKNERALTEAWDFFKEESKILGDSPGEKVVS